MLFRSDSTIAKGLAQNYDGGILLNVSGHIGLIIGAGDGGSDDNGFLDYPGLIGSGFVLSEHDQADAVPVATPDVSTDHNVVKTPHFIPGSHLSVGHELESVSNPQISASFNATVWYKVAPRNPLALGWQLCVLNNTDSRTGGDSGPITNGANGICRMYGECSFDVFAYTADVANFEPGSY